MKRLFFLAVILTVQYLSGTAYIFAQDESIQKDYDAHTYYTYAERYYDYGYFDTAIEYLDKLKTSQDATVRSSAYRLKALCHIEMGNIAQAKQDVQDLLATDPYFSPSASDNPIFLNLVNTSKKTGGATITTASQQAETLEEAPVPVTLITEEMIKACGARTLKEALLVYVPGMTDIASNEDVNIAMRGVYSSSQEKILFLLNGHRLNSYSTNAYGPGHVSLEKIKQIEVLRGPASSIYGGVALTGVVNIITKEDLDFDGFKAKLSAGNHSQIQGDLLLCKRYMNLSLTAWANIYASKGEEVFLSPADQHYGYNILGGIERGGNIYIDKYGNRPTYDIGSSISFKEFKLLFNSTYTNRASTYSIDPLFSPYTYDKYRKIDNDKPGNSVSSNFLELSYSHKFNKLTLSASVSYDWKTIHQYQILGDTIPDLGGYDIIIPNGTTEEVKVTTGYFQSASFSESTLNGKIQLNYNYSFGKHSGNILFGIHTSLFSLDDACYQEGDNYDRILKVYGREKTVYTGKEEAMDAYVQLKHSINQHFIFNAGIRYDYKQSKTITDVEDFTQGTDQIHVLSPRIAFILKQDKWNMRLSYSKAFVDAPYFYRNNTLDSNYGIYLQPEYLHSVQLSFNSNEQIKGLRCEMNVFFNSLNNYIYNSIGQGFLVNGGKYNNIGLEVMAQYDIRKFKVMANATVQRRLKSENFGVVDGNPCNIPSFQANIIGTYDIMRDLRLHANVRYTNSQKAIAMTTEEVIDIPANVLAGIGADYKIKKVSLSFNIHNILGTTYTRGGSVTAPIRQQGRWFLGSIAYNF